VDKSISEFERSRAAIPADAYNNLYAMESLKESSRLVSGSWWRVFGILLLFGILTSLVTTLVSTPIAFLTMWDFYKEYFGMLGASSKSGTDPAAMSKMFQSIGKGVGINLSVQFILSAVLTPIYLSVFYFDLRARKEILESAEYQPSELFSSLQHDINSAQHGT
jgi:hypothetical protein